MHPPPSYPTAALLVAGGGAAGSCLRFTVGRLWLMAVGPVVSGEFPWATLSVNVTGSLAMGVFVGWLARHSAGGETWQLLIGLGLIGGFTTFSSFALEFVMFVERGALATGLAYVAVTLFAGIGALFAGLFIARAAG